MRGRYRLPRAALKISRPEMLDGHYGRTLRPKVKQRQSYRRDVICRGQKAMIYAAIDRPPAH